MITIEKFELQQLMKEAAKLGAQEFMSDMALYHMKDAAKLLGVSYGTLQARIKEGKIRPVDGRITGAEIRRYLTQSSRNI